jgi:hypothetical protein
LPRVCTMYYVWPATSQLRVYMHMGNMCISV